MSETTNVFREAKPAPAEVKSEPKSEGKAPVKKLETGGTPVETKIDSLLATYQDDQGKPYVAQYLGLDEVWDQDKTLKNELNTIEGYIREQISKGKVENSTKAGEKYLKELEKKAETNPYESTTNRISKLLAYIEFKKVIEK